MAFPSVAATASGNENTEVTSHSLTLPTHSAGQLLFVQFCANGFETCTVNTVASGTGWRNYGMASANGQSAAYFFWKIADDASEVLTITSNTVAASTHISYAIDDATDVQINADFSAATTNADPPELDMETSRDYEWIAGCAVDNDVLATGSPSGFDAATTIASGFSGGCGLSSAVKTTQTALSTLNPGIFQTTSEEWASWTVAFWIEEVDSTFYEFKFPLDASSTIWEDGWTFDNQATSMSHQSGQERGHDTMYGNTRANTAADSATTDGIFEWTGTFEDLGVTPGRVVTGYSEMTFYGRLTAAGGSVRWADILGGSGAFTIVEPGPSERVLIADQAVVTINETGHTKFTASPVTGLILATDDTITLRIYTRHISDTQTVVSRVSGVRLQISSVAPVENFATVIAVTATVTPAIEQPEFISTTTSVSSLTVQAFETARDASTAISVASTVAGVLPITRSSITSLAVTSTVTPTLHRAVDAITTVAAATTVTALFSKLRFMAATTTVASTVVGVLPIPRLLSTVVTVASTVTAANDATRGLMGASVVQSAITNASLHNDHVRYATAIAATSTVAANVGTKKPFASTTTATSSLLTRLMKAPFPTVISRTTGTAGNATSHSIPVQTHLEGDHIVVVFNWHVTSFIDIVTSGSYAAGWRTSGSRRDSPASGGVFHKIATANDSDLSTLTVDLSFTQAASWVVFVIRNGQNISVSGKEQSSGQPNWTELDLDKDKSVLWIATYGTTDVFGSTDRQMTSAPTNYANLTTASSLTEDDPFTQTAERLLLANAETPPDGVVVDDTDASVSFTIGVWGNETEEVTSKFAFGDFGELDGWAFTEVRTSGAGSISGSHNGSEDVSFGDVGGALALGVGFPTDVVVSDSYFEWSGTFEDLGVPASSTVLGYSEASFFYNARFYTNPVTFFVGDDLGSRGAFSIDDGSVRSLIQNQPDPSGTGTKQIASDPVSVTGLVLPAQTPITLRVTSHGDSASGGSATMHVDEMSLTMIAPPGWETTDVAIESPDFVVQGRPYPVITDSVTGTQAGGATSAALTLPTHVAGQLLLITIHSQTEDQFLYNDEADGWDIVIGANNEAIAYSRVATGAGTTFTIRANIDIGDLSYIAYAIDNATIAHGEHVRTTVASTTPKPIDMQVTKPAMFFVVRGQDFTTLNFTGESPTAPPAGYFNMQSVPGVLDTNPYLHVANRIDHVSSETPGAWGDSGTATGSRQQFTIAVHDNIDDLNDAGLQMRVNIPLFQDHLSVDRTHDFAFFEDSGTMSTGFSFVNNASGFGAATFISDNVDSQVEMTRTGTLQDFGVPVGHAITAIRSPRMWTETNTDGGGNYKSGSPDITGILLYYTTPVTLRAHAQVDFTGPATNTMAARDDNIFNAALTFNDGNVEHTLVPNQPLTTGAVLDIANIEFTFDYESVAAVLFDPPVEIAVESPDFGVSVTARLDPTNVAVESPDFQIQHSLDFDPATEIAIESLDFLVAKSARLISTTTAVSTVAGQPFEVARGMNSTTTVATTVTGNIVEQLQLIGTTVAQSAVITPTNLEVARNLISTTNAVVNVTGALGFFEAVVSVASNVTADAEVTRPLSTIVAATSAVTPAAARNVDWATVTNVASVVFPSTIEREVAFDSATAVTSVVTPFLSKIFILFATTTGAALTVTPSLARTQNYNTAITSVVSVGGNIVEGLRFVSAIVAQSALVLPTTIERTVNWNTTITPVSTVTVGSLIRQASLESLSTVVTTGSGTLVVITNTLLLTFSETSFVEVSERVLQLVTVNTDNTHIVNETDELTLITTELGSDVVITDTTDN